MTLKYIPGRNIQRRMVEKVQLWGYRCERCGHEWLPREKARDPKVCPRCKSPYWDRPRQVSKASEPKRRASDEKT